MRNNLEFFLPEDLPLVIFQMLAQGHILHVIAHGTDKVMMVTGINFVMSGFAGEPDLADNIIFQ